MNIILPRCHRAPLAADLPNREATTDEASWTQQQPEGGDHDDDEEEEVKEKGNGLQYLEHPAP